jgi:ClpP class serine protease
MTEVPLGELGPVDYVIVEFPAGASSFTGEMATELSDIDELGELQTIEAELAELLAEEDVDQLAAAMAPGSSAGVLIWENLWAAPFASAARRSGGQLIADGRIPIQAIIASIEADETIATAGD